ncbi:ABC transporter substrate-binding protein [Litorilinea aerophila]|nr:ABC transporter substrate-binding protein [Litorilinea aerophila]MCC9076385.1 ABC transporter substrate-binding protein [Litorilinea aerophila]
MTKQASEKRTEKSRTDMNRRDFLRLSGLATAGVIAAACGGGQTAAPAAAPSGGEAAGGAAAPAEGAAQRLKDVPRERTLIVMWAGTDGQFTDVGLANGYATGSKNGHRAVLGAFEPLFYYSAFADEVIPWLATDAQYNDDYTELTVKIREGVEWSDGTPFTANDVAFTLQMLKDNEPFLRDSTAIKAWVESTEVVDDLTVVIKFYEPRPRFLFDKLYGKFDTGIWWVPAHIFKDVDEIQGFGFYDLEKGWPVVTGPYNVVDWTPQQQTMDRRDDWWAAKIGFAELPEIERIIVIPWTSEERASQLMILNEIDSSLDLRATTISQVVAQNPAVITHTGRELPYGYIDWWPTSFWFNCDEPPFNDPNVRWAVSYTIDRQQMLDVALEGSGILTELPFPYYPPLMPYIEATKPLLEQYPTNEHNLDKAAERMRAAGYEKDSEGFWVKDGQRVEASIVGGAIFNDIGPVLAEQLRRGGFEAEYITPADAGTRRSDGTAKISLFGHGGSIADPFDTLDMYTSKYYRPTGEPAQFFSRYRNPEYDAILEEMASMRPDPDDPQYMDLYLAAIEIYLRDLIDCPIQQWLHRIPMNTTYWTNWPTQDNNYVNGAFWHQTVGLILHNLKATQA